MKKILKILAAIIILVICIIFYISYITDNNEQTLKKTTQKIKTHYKTDEEITYTNEYGNYYIIKTKSKVIVLSKNYQEIVKEELSKLKEDIPNTNIIYKTNKLIYEKKLLKNKTLIYEYYDAKTGEKIDETTLELK